MVVRKGIIYFHLIENNIPFNSISNTDAIDAIQFSTETEVIYSKKGDPDELGKYLTSFLQSSHHKNIDGFETFLYENKISQRKCRAISSNIHLHTNIVFRYHVVVDVYNDLVTCLSLETNLDKNKLHDIFPNFFDYANMLNNKSI